MAFPQEKIHIHNLVNLQTCEHFAHPPLRLWLFRSGVFDEETNAMKLLCFICSL